MASPSVTTTRAAGSLSPIGPLPSKALVIGPASLSGSVANKVYTFSQPGLVAATIGYGPAQIAAAKILADNGGSIDVVVSAATNPGTVSTVVSGSGVSTMTVTGAPFDSYTGVVTLVASSSIGPGAAGTARFTFSLDNSSNTSPAITVPANGTYAIPNTNLTLTWASGSFTGKPGDSWTFNAFAPYMAGADFTTAANAFTGSLTTPLCVYAAQDGQVSGSNAAFFSAVDAINTTFATNGINCPFIIPAMGTDAGTTGTIASLTGSGASGTGTYGQNVDVVVAERAQCAIPVPFMGYGNPKLPFGLAVASRVTGDNLSSDPGRVKTGPLPGWSNPTYDENVNGEVYLDQSIVAPITYRNYPGVYVEQGVVKVAAGSNYGLLGADRVLLLADTIITAALKKYLNSTVRVKKDGSGAILPADAARINSDVQTQLNAVIMQPLNAEGTPGLASAVQFLVDPTYNVLTNKKLQANCAIIPLAQISQVTVQLGFSVSVTPVTA